MLFPWKRRARHRGAGAMQGGARFDASRARVISSHDELLALKPALLRPLSAELGVEELASRLCPVLLADHSVAILSLAAHVGSDQADELARRIAQAGHIPATPARYVLAAPLLLAVARNQVGFDVAPRAVEPLREHSRPALAQAFQDMIDWGVRSGASDLHINIWQGEADSEVKYTLSGRYVAPERFRRMPTTMLLDMLAVAWMDIRGGNGAVFDPGAEQQGSLHKQVDGRPVLLRWASLAAERGPSVCIRLLERGTQAAQLTLEQLGYPRDQIQAIERALLTQGGAIVFAGAVGSGKSTTLASLIARLPEERKVITLEDPVEYLIPRAIQNSVVRDFGRDAVDGFGIKLRALKRSAMNDVLLGEIRDRETGAAFMDLAGSGINVYSTTHALSAALIPERLASDFIGVSRDLLATPGVLKLLVYQTLLPRLCTRCAIPAELLWRERPAPFDERRTAAGWHLWVRHAAESAGADPGGLKLRNPAGCQACRGALDAVLAGYRGRTVASEYIEPASSPAYLEGLRSKDGAMRWRQDVAPARTALGCALQKAFQGELDLRDVERGFGSLDHPA